MSHLLKCSSASSWRDGSALLGIFQPLPRFVEDIDVVLDVLQGAVLGELPQQQLDLLFRRGHREARIALRQAKSWTGQPIPWNPTLAPRMRKVGAPGSKGCNRIVVEIWRFTPIIPSLV